MNCLQAKATAECFQECASSYEIVAAEDKGANMALAKPKTSTCKKEDQSDHVGQKSFRIGT